MAPKNRSQPYDSAANLTEEELPLPMRFFIDKSIYEIRSSAERLIYEARKKLVELAWDELHNNPSYSHSNASSSRSHDQAIYEIVITPALKPIIYTGSKIKGQNDEAIKVAIYKNGTKDTSGLFASAKVEILAIHGIFYKERKKDWTFDEFDNNIAKRREDKPPIMAGKLELDLINGEGILPDIVFRDNSSWSPDTKFLIGARLWETPDVRVKEGITGPIRVLDVHGIATDKSRVPKLEDGVTRLKGVGQKRVADLKGEGINTLRDFLRLSYMDEPRLLKIVGITSSSHESWKTMFDHAKKCEIGPDLYSFPVTVKNQNVMLFFSYVYELVGTEIDGYYKHYNGATKLLKKGDYDKAGRYYMAAVKYRNLNFILPFYGLAQIQLKMKDFKNSLSSIEKVLQIYPENIESLKVIGHIHGQLQQNEKAIETFRKVTRIDPKDFQALLELGELLICSDINAALDALKNAKTLLKKNNEDIPIELLNTIGVLHFEKEDFEFAEQTFKEVLGDGILSSLFSSLKSENNSGFDLTPDKINTLNLRDLSAFRQLEEEGISLDLPWDKVTTLFNYARLLEHRHDISKATLLYQFIVFKYPGYVDGYLRLAAIAKSRNDPLRGWSN